MRLSNPSGGALNSERHPEWGKIQCPKCKEMVWVDASDTHRCKVRWLWAQIKRADTIEAGIRKQLGTRYRPDFYDT
jgi:hypothetical protein